MFGGPSYEAEPPTKAEIKAAEKDVQNTINWTLGTCAVLYLSPFVIQYAQFMF